MNSLISINSKFMSVSPKELVKMILNFKYTKGFEVFFDCDSEVEMKYLDDLVYEIKKNNLILQVHCNSEVQLDKQLDYLKKIEGYADYLGSKIVLTFHSIYDADKDLSCRRTVEYLSSIISSVNNDKLIICLENLNDSVGLDRLEKEYITPLILNDESLYFTYDIGHEIVEYGGITNLNEYVIGEIRNVHIHTSDGKGIDHLPIYRNAFNWNNIKKGLVFLINNKYNYNIVYEYDLYFCNGDTIEEKIIDYLTSIDLVSEHYCN